MLKILVAGKVYMSSEHGGPGHNEGSVLEDEPRRPRHAVRSHRAEGDELNPLRPAHYQPRHASAEEGGRPVGPHEVRVDRPRPLPGGTRGPRHAAESGGEVQTEAERNEAMRQLQGREPLGRPDPAVREQAAQTIADRSALPVSNEANEIPFENLSYRYHGQNGPVTGTGYDQGEYVRRALSGEDAGTDIVMRPVSQEELREQGEAGARAAMEVLGSDGGPIETIRPDERARGTVAEVQGGDSPAELDAVASARAAVHEATRGVETPTAPEAAQPEVTTAPAAVEHLVSQEIERSRPNGRLEKVLGPVADRVARTAGWFFHRPFGQGGEVTPQEAHAALEDVRAARTPDQGVIGRRRHKGVGLMDYQIADTLVEPTERGGVRATVPMPKEVDSARDRAKADPTFEPEGVVRATAKVEAGQEAEPRPGEPVTAPLELASDADIGEMMRHRAEQGSEAVPMPIAEAVLKGQYHIGRRVTVRDAGELSGPDWVVTALARNGYIPVGIPGTSAERKMRLTELNDMQRVWRPGDAVRYHTPDGTIHKMEVAGATGDGIVLVQYPGFEAGYPSVPQRSDELAGGRPELASPPAGERGQVAISPEAAGKQVAMAGGGESTKVAVPGRSGEVTYRELPKLEVRHYYRVPGPVLDAMQEDTAPAHPELTSTPLEQRFPSGRLMVVWEPSADSPDGGYWNRDEWSVDQVNNDGTVTVSRYDLEPGGDIDNRITKVLDKYALEEQPVYRPNDPVTVSVGGRMEQRHVDHQDPDGTVHIRLLAPDEAEITFPAALVAQMQEHPEDFEMRVPGERPRESLRSKAAHAVRVARKAVGRRRQSDRT